MSTDLRKVTRGEDFAMPASLFNTLADVAREYRDRRGGGDGPGSLGPSAGNPTLLVEVLNDSAADIAPFGVRTAGASVLVPTGDVGHQVSERPILTALDTTAAGIPLVARFPIAVGTIGLMAIRGVTVADVDVVSTSHLYAKPVAADLLKLRSDTTGPVRLIDTPAAAGVQRLTVELLGVEGGGTAGDGVDDTTGHGPGNGTDALGHSLFCQELDEYGEPTGTLLRRETRPDRSVRCVALDPCCASNWFCVRNAVIEGLCCDETTPFVWTKYLKVNFTAKTGAATELPDSIILVYQTGGYGYGGTQHLWTGAAGGAFPLGLAGVTGGVVFDCGELDPYYGEEVEIAAIPTAGTILASLQLTGFEADDPTPVEVPCEPTAEDFPIDLGSFAYTETTTNRCGVDVERTGTVGVSFEVWKEDGVVEIVAGVVPPYDAEGPYRTEEEAAACCPVTLPCFGDQTFEMPPVVRLEFLEVLDRQNGATGWPFGTTGFGTLTVPASIPMHYGGVSGFKFEVPPAPVCGEQFPFEEDANSGVSCGTFTFAVTCVEGVSKTPVAAGANGVSPSQTFAADDADPFFDTTASPTTPGWQFRLTMIPSVTPPANLVVTFLVSHPSLGTGVREWFKPATDPLKTPTDSGGLEFEADVFVNVALGAYWKVRGRVSW